MLGSDLASASGFGLATANTFWFVTTATVFFICSPDGESKSAGTTAPAWFELLMASSSGITTEMPTARSTDGSSGPSNAAALGSPAVLSPAHPTGSPVKPGKRPPDPGVRPRPPCRQTQGPAGDYLSLASRLETQSNRQRLAVTNG